VHRDEADGWSNKINDVEVVVVGFLDDVVVRVLDRLALLVEQVQDMREGKKVFSLIFAQSMG
jgi:hypothetical protein